MRKTTKALMIAGTGTVLALGIVFGTGKFAVDALAQSGAIAKKVEIRVEPEVTEPQKDIQEVLKEQAQERATQEVAAQREALVAEGSKAENKTVDGVESQVKGLYLLNDINGMSIVPDSSYYAAEGNTSEDPSKCEIVAYETDAAKSPQAIECVKEVLSKAEPTAVIGPSVNVQYKWPEGQEDSKMVGDFKFGIDESFAKEGAQYAVVSIYPGGFYQIYKDTDDNPNTISVRAAGNYADNLVMFTIIRID